MKQTERQQKILRVLAPGPGRGKAMPMMVALSAGFDAYLVKPVSGEVLLRTAASATPKARAGMPLQP